MENGICIYSTVPCRETPAHTSQLTTQLLFGETYTVEAISGDWLQVRIHHDRYTAWIRSNQHTPVAGKDFPKTVNTALFASASANEQEFPVPLGCYLPNGKPWHIGDTVFTATPPAHETATLEHFCGLLLHTPYLWGGRTPMGIDCSGFTQLILRLLGKNILRDAAEQAEQGTLISFIHEALPGDLAFFDNEEGRITHVGIVLDNNRIVHASGSVRIDRLDHEGIYNATEKRYTHRLRIIKRIS